MPFVFFFVPFVAIILCMQIDSEMLIDAWRTSHRVTVYLVENLPIEEIISRVYESGRG